MKNQIRIVPVLALAALLGLGGVLIFFLTSEPQDVKDFFAQRPTFPTFPTVSAPKPAPIEQTATFVVAPPPPPPKPHDEPPHRPPPKPDQWPAPPMPPQPWVKRSAQDCMAMTWRVLGQQQMKVTVGHVPNVTNPYVGDTPCSEKRMLLCIRIEPAKSDRRAYLPPEWNEMHVFVIPEVRGSELTSRAVADERCAKKFGTGWRMAEFHDGGAWSLSANGELPRDAQFWVAIRDQHSNPWD